MLAEPRTSSFSPNPVVLPKAGRLGSGGIQSGGASRLKGAGTRAYINGGRGYAFNESTTDRPPVEV